MSKQNESKMLTVCYEHVKTPVPYHKYYLQDHPSIVTALPAKPHGWMA
jgi:hypothetical protein